MAYRPIHAPLQTGQTVSYAAADDGQYRAGRVYPSVRFVDVGTNLLVDRHAGLMWVKQATAIVPNTSIKAQNPRGTWLANTAYVLSDLVKDETTTNTGVASSQTFISSGVYELTASSGTFSAQDVGRRIYRIVDGRYGTITSFISSTKIRFGPDPDASTMPWFSNGDTWHVRDFEGIFVCQAPVNAATRPHDDPTHWAATTWNLTAASFNDARRMNWDSALAACADLVYHGFSDWRLPNLYELLSLAHFGQTSAPYAQGVVTVNSSTADYWSSTTRPSSTTAAMWVNYWNATTGNWNKTSVSPLVMPVRGGLIHG